MSTEIMNKVIDRRYDFVFLFDVKDGNPNGDPDAGNLPRFDPHTMQGLVTDGCIKRKIRNTIEILKGSDASEPESDTSLKGQRRFEIYFKHQGVLNSINRRAFTALGIEAVEGKTEEEEIDEGNTTEEPHGKKAKSGKVVKNPNTAPARMEQARQWMCRNFFDVRVFGAVMSTGVNAGQVRGPVQITYSRSIDPILPQEFSITRKSVNKEDDAQKQIAKHGFITGTMGRKNTLAYALYRGHGFVNPYLAMGEKGTGCTYGDLKALFEAMLRMFDFDQSSSHGTMALRRIDVFEHRSPLGCARATDLLERVRVEPFALTNANGESRLPRDFADYADRISVNNANLPNGISYYGLPGDFDKLLQNV